MSEILFRCFLSAWIAALSVPVVAQSFTFSDRPAPIEIAQGIAPVTRANTWRSGTSLIAEFTAEPGRESLPVVDPKREDPDAGMLRRLYARGQAAGLAGVIYDNRDRGHSRLDKSAFPQLSRSTYPEYFQAIQLDHNVAGKVLFTLPVIGNSSTAYTRGPLARSLGRAALGSQREAMRAYRAYASNHLYVYPEHRDYDAETGDRLFANAPYFMLSQGSSHSDRPFLMAYASVIAAYRPETLGKLVEFGLLAPTTQMILRRTQAGVDTREDYLSAAAHPPVFDGNALRVGRSIRFANALSPDALPPIVHLTVVKDFAARVGVDYLAQNLSEEIFTTPSAIARAWRSFEYSREITLSAADTVDPNGRPLTFHWVVTQGDVEQVRIRQDGSEATIQLDWPDAEIRNALSGIRSSRIDVAVFADNGVSLSAPGFFSVSLPLFQNRVYGSQRSGAHILQSLNYEIEEEDLYADRSLWPTAPWSDRLIWSHEGALLSLERLENGKKETVFFADDLGRSASPASKSGAHEVEVANNGVLTLRTTDHVERD